MKNISAKETKPEIIVRKFLFSHGFRFRKNVKDLPGKPDIVLPKYKTIIFVHGCFWHGHDCKAAKLPETNAEFWVNKIDGNILRDERCITDLKSLGWNVVVIWQCEIKNRELRQTRFDILIKQMMQFKSDSCV